MLIQITLSPSDPEDRRILEMIAKRWRGDASPEKPQAPVLSPASSTSTEAHEISLASPRSEEMERSFVAKLSCGCERRTTDEKKKRFLETSGTCWKHNPEAAPRSAS